MSPELEPVTLPRPPDDPPRWLLGLLALTAGATSANLYYCQPLLGAMGAAFHVGSGRITAVATATQLGYATGLLLIVPLGDSLERKRLIVGTTLLSALALTASALSPSTAWLVASGYATGAICVTPQLAVTYAANIAAPERRGRTVGMVMSGLLIGILLSRTLSGAIGARATWQTVYWCASALMVSLGTLLAVAIPVQKPAGSVSYVRLLASLWPMIRDEPVLRRHALVGALGFGAFSTFWTTLAFHLASLPGHYGSQTAGLFGLVGAAGALAAVVAGRLAERVGPRTLNGTALGLALISFGLMAASARSLVALALGVVGMDAGVQASHISNQTRIYALGTEERNRLNSVYMVSYFVGGACGSAAGAHAWAAYGWPGVCGTGSAFTAAAMLVLFTVGRGGR